MGWEYEQGWLKKRRRRVQTERQPSGGKKSRPPFLCFPEASPRPRIQLSCRLSFVNPPGAIDLLLPVQWIPSSNRVRAHLRRSRETRHVSPLPAGPSSLLQYLSSVRSITGPARNTYNQAWQFLGRPALVCLFAFPGSPLIFPRSRFHHEEGNNAIIERITPEIHPLARKAAENQRRTHNFQPT